MTVSSSPPPVIKHKFWEETVPHFLNYLMLLLSLGLIAFISWDTYQGINFINNALYMKYQFGVCIVFLAEYLYRFITSKHKWRFLFLGLPFLAISIPYLNLIEYYGIWLDQSTLYYLRFIPIIRGLLSLVIVVAYVTENLSTTVFVSYVFVLIPIIYMSGLIFYFSEREVNTALKNIWYAMWWAGMNATTIGCYINPVTGTGMIISLVLSLLGIIMFPLFTVYFGNFINSFSHKAKRK